MARLRLVVLRLDVIGQNCARFKRCAPNLCAYGVAVLQALKRRVDHDLCLLSARRGKDALARIDEHLRIELIRLANLVEKLLRALDVVLVDEER